MVLELAAQQESLETDLTMERQLIVAHFMALKGRRARKSFIADLTLKGPLAGMGVHMPSQ